MKVVRLNEAGIRRIVRQVVSEQAAPSRGRGMNLEKAVTIIKQAGPDATKGQLLPAYKILAKFFDGSPTPSQDIASYLEDQGIDPDFAFDVGDEVEMNYLGGGYGGDYGGYGL